MSGRVGRERMRARRGRVERRRVRKERERQLKIRLYWPMVNERSDCTDDVHICINRFDQIMVQ